MLSKLIDYPNNFYTIRSLRPALITVENLVPIPCITTECHKTTHTDLTHPFTTFYLFLLSLLSFHFLHPVRAQIHRLNKIEGCG